MNYIRVCKQGSKILKAYTGAELGLDDNVLAGTTKFVNGLQYIFNGSSWDLLSNNNPDALNWSRNLTKDQLLANLAAANTAASNVTRLDGESFRDYRTRKKQAEGLADAYDDAVGSNADIQADNAVARQNSFKSIVNADSTSGAGKVMGGTSQLASLAFNALDQGLMGDKNFGALSQAIDTAVHGVSGALMKSGNPYAMAAGAGLEAANFLTKAGGQTVQGFDVDINSSGYGNLGHQDSTSSRDFGAMMGLGGLNGAKMDRMLANRNELALMALKAANVADTIKYEQEARMNSVDDVIRQNEIALSGGIDTSLLAN